MCLFFQCTDALQTVHYYASKSEFNSLLLKLDGIFQPLVCSRKRICDVMGLLLCQWRLYCRDKAQCIYPSESSRSFGVYQLTIFFSWLQGLSSQRRPVEPRRKDATPLCENSVSLDLPSPVMGSSKQQQLGESKECALGRVPYKAASGKVRII